MYILGISAFYHDSGACFLKDGEIVYASQEERFSRIKNDSSFPSLAIIDGLEFLDINLEEVSEIVFYEKPFLKFERLILTYIKNIPFGLSQFLKSMIVWGKEKLFQRKLINDHLNKILQSEKKINFKIKFSEHHLSHSASAFYPSNFKEAAIITADGVGEFSTTTISHGNDDNITIIKKIDYPDSLGLLYSAFTYYLGFRVNSDEYKVMGLAPYGEPKYKSKILNSLVDVKDDGSFILNQKYFSYSTGLVMTNKNFDNLMEKNQRKKNGPINQNHMDLASSIQSITEDIMILICRHAKKITNSDNLCLAGGVALNCVANGKIINSKIFNKVWIQPAAGDAGGSLGAALSYWYRELGKPRTNFKDQMNGSYLGPKFDEAEIDHTLKELKANFKKLSQQEIISITAKELSNNKIIGWFQGQMEFGPRTLGNRSILADPRSEKMQKELNLKIKFRESFRPFAPSVLREHVSEWFDIDTDSPYMLLVAEVNKSKQINISINNKQLFGIEKLNIKRSSIPAVTHVDYSARIQTVHKETNLKYHNLISEFNKITNCPVLVNTSFNVRGEPIVCSVEDAFNCFMGTNLDILVIENFILYKKKQDKSLLKDYKNNFELD